MRLTLSDVEFINGKSGTGLRCTLSLSAQHPLFGPITQSTKGCLAFRNRKGVINFLCPVMYLGAAKVRYRPITLSPGLNLWLQSEIEKAHGTFITRKEPVAGSGIAASRVGAPVELDLGEI